MRTTFLMLAASLVLAAPTGAAAQVRSTDMTCAQTAALVNQRGAVVVATSPTLYDRYVRDISFCNYDEQLKPEWVPTRDVRQCFIGYICYEPARGGGRSGN